MSKFLKEVFSDETGMPARAARGNHDLINGAEFRDTQVQPAKFGRALVVIHAAAQRVFHSARLFKDFLEHVMREVAAFRGFGVKLELTDLNLGCVRTEA